MAGSVRNQDATFSNIAALVPRSDDGRLSPLDHAELRWPQYEADEVQAVVAVLNSGRVNSLVHGNYTRELEHNFAAYCGVPHAIAVSNGTAALELALRALGVGPGDEVIVASRSFFASAAAIVAVGATPAFADIDPVSQTIDPSSARSLVTARTRAIICVHLAGWPCDMKALLKLAEDADLWLIEDCAQAHGATYEGQRVGSFGDAAAFSFCTDKIMSTGGEGGILLLQASAHWAKAWAFKDHGKNPDKILGPVSGHCFRYVHDTFGTNWRMTEMQAAIGLHQLTKLPRWLEQRRTNADALLKYLEDEPRIYLPRVPAQIEHAFYRFYITVDDTCLDANGNVNHLIERMIEMGMPVSGGSCANMSLETAFTGANVRCVDLRVATDLGRRTIALPVDHLLDKSDMHRMANCLRIALAEAATAAIGLVQ